MVDIIEFLENKGINYKKISNNMYHMLIENYNIGSISYSGNNIIVRFYYEKYHTNFIFEYKLFDIEYKKAFKSYINHKNEEVEKVLSML